ncbi:hypothetical protein F4677DRAFT_184219 [Hypoxylon crocopeplum]|nr:hypothetical protein F4677DRAFT_184219 [Hypoxylon crocopeplum]
MMGDADPMIGKIDKWVADGALSRENILWRLDERIKTTLAIYLYEKRALEAVFMSACHLTDSCDGDVLSRASFLSLLHVKGDFPRGLEGVGAGRIIYDCISYLAMLPFPPHGQAKVDELSIVQLTRGLAWALPDRAGYIVEESSSSRMRTRFDHHRLLFQSLATITTPSTVQEDVRDSARALARSSASDIPKESRDLCSLNHDDDGDEIYHDLLDILYATQEIQHPGITPVPRDAFRAVAKQIKARAGLPDLHALAIPVPRFRTLVKALLWLQFEHEIDENAMEVEQFEDAAQAICRAFMLGQDQGTDRTASEGFITWPSFSHALRTAAPHLFDPFYHILSLTFLGEPNPIGVLDAMEPPPVVDHVVLTQPRAGQIVSFLAHSIYTGYLKRKVRYIRPLFISPATLIQIISDCAKDAIVLISGSTVTPGSTKGELCIFGLFTPAPRKDRFCIQAPDAVDSLNAGQQQCMLFQLAPVQDVFRGVVGAAGWDNINVHGIQTLVFGRSGGAGDQEGGVVLSLRNNLSRGEILHVGSGPVVEADRVGNGISYRANPCRGDWKSGFIVQNIEVWSEVEDSRAPSASSSDE